MCLNLIESSSKDLHFWFTVSHESFFGRVQEEPVESRVGWEWDVDVDRKIKIKTSPPNNKTSAVFPVEPKKKSLSGKISRL